jgi:hypothetical protein
LRGCFGLRDPGVFVEREGEAVSFGCGVEGGDLFVGGIVD